MKLYIAIDFDDVIADTVPVVLDALNQRQPEELHTWRPEDITSWNMAACTGHSEDTVQETFHSIDMRDVPAVVGAGYVVRELIEDGHSVHILTQNPRVYDIRPWLDRNGFRDVPLSRSKDKTSWLQGRGYNVIIDDNPKTLQACSREGIWAIRFDRPWNRDINSAGASPGLPLAWGTYPNEFSVSSWLGVLTAVKMISERGKTSTYKAVDDIVTNENGAKQTDIKGRWDLLPARAIEEVARVLQHGADKYGVDNWRGLSVEEIHNHTLRHAINFNQTKNLEDLAHMATRALMTLEIYLEDKK